MDFTANEVRKYIRGLKSGKAAGDDQILNEYLKANVDSCMPLYVTLSNLILRTGQFPVASGPMVPSSQSTKIKSSRMTQTITLYWGITPSCFGKLFTSILNNRLTDYLEEYDLMSEVPAGFRHGCSTIDHVFTLSCLIDIYIWARKENCMLLLLSTRKHSTVSGE